MSKVLIYQQVHVAVEETVAVVAETLASKVTVTILYICTWAEQQLPLLMLTLLSSAALSPPPAFPPLMTPLFLPLPSLFTDLFGGSVPRAYMSAPILVNYCNNWAGIWPPSICKVLFVEQIDIPRGNLFV